MILEFHLTTFLESGTIIILCNLDLNYFCNLVHARKKVDFEAFWQSLDRSFWIGHDV